MSKPITAQTTWTIISTLLLLGVLAFAGYTYINGSKAPSVSVAHTSYNLGAIDEMKKDPKTQLNVFEYTSSLHDVPQSAGSNVQYSPSDLGKKDLSRPE